MTQFDEEMSTVEKVDSRDLKIIELLKENARTTYQQIAKKVLLSHDAVAERVKKLHTKGIISKFTLDINYRLLDYDEYYLFLQLLENDEEELTESKKFYRFLKQQARIEGRSVIVVDEGIRSGETMFAALSLIRLQNPRHLVVAAPVATAEATQRMSVFAMP